MRLKIFKHSKLAHPEDIDDQIFAHSVLAKVYQKLYLKKEMMHQFEEIKQLLQFKNQGKVYI